jgi:hypothetical protein
MPAAEVQGPRGLGSLTARPAETEGDGGSPVELLLSGRVAVGGVPAVEVVTCFVPKPFDGLVIEPGHRG